MADFNTAFGITMGHEGAWVDDKDDRGGETYRGIARNFWPKWEGWGIIDEKKHYTPFPNNLKGNSELDNFVKQFYKREFWNTAHLDDVHDQDIANEIFDTAVNMGPKTARRMLQKALNLLNRNQKDYRDLTVDGVIGPETLGALNGNRRPKNVLKALNGLQFMRYVKIVKRNPDQEKFFNGWLNRVW